MNVSTIILEQIRSLGWVVKTFRVNGAIEITHTPGPRPWRISLIPPMHSKNCGPLRGATGMQI
jgi:hypothetical protein